MNWEAIYSIALVVGTLPVLLAEILDYNHIFLVSLFHEQKAIPGVNHDIRLDK